MTALAAALRDEQYELAALRLLLGLLVAMRETAPAAREELLALVAADGDEDDRAHAHGRHRAHAAHRSHRARRRRGSAGAERRAPGAPGISRRGCDLFASCLACPLRRCRYDVPGGVRALLNRERDHQIRVMRDTGGLCVDDIAARFRVSRRTVFRALQQRGACGASDATARDEHASD